MSDPATRWNERSFRTVFAIFCLHFIFYFKVNDKLKTVQNTALWMMLSLNSKREMIAKRLPDKVSQRNPAVQLQNRRLNLWANLHRKGDTIAKPLLISRLAKAESRKITNSKSWLKQLKTDVSLRAFGEKVGVIWILIFKKKSIPLTLEH